MTELSTLRKSPDAYRTISEVATDLKLPQHVLRFWETRFPQVKPLKRAGGRRFYRPEDVELLRAVKTLLYGDGYTIKGVQRILREQGPRAVAALADAPGRGAVLRQGEPRPAEPAGLVAPPAPASLPIAAAEAMADPDDAALERAGDDEPVRRLRQVLAELRDCAETLARARAASRQARS